MQANSFTETRDINWTSEWAGNSHIVKVLAAGIKEGDIQTFLDRGLLTVSIDGTLFAGHSTYKIPVPVLSKITATNLSDGVFTVVLRNPALDFEDFHRDLSNLALKVNPSRTLGGVYAVHYNKSIKKWCVSDPQPHCVPAVGHLFETPSAAKEACRIMNEEAWRPIDVA